MSDPRVPGDDLPPDLPPEYAEAYRRGYERAYEETLGGTQPPVEPQDDADGDAHEQPPAPAEASRISGPLFADEVDDDVEPTQVVRLTPEPATTTVATPAAHLAAAAPEPSPGWDGGLTDDLVRDHDGDHYDHYDDYADERRRPGWFVPALLGGLVLLLVLGAYGIGRILSSSVGDAEVSTEQPDGVVLGDGAQSAAADEGPGKPERERPDAYQGRTDLAAIGGATATCQAPASVDAAGNQVAYPPTNTYDGDLSTAWRCNGDGVGQSLTLTLPEATRIGEVGLVPGYAKTDPRSGVDRYAENNRITKVRWVFADGTSFVQRLDGSPTNRQLQTTRIPVTESNSVVMEVLASTAGPRNTMAVSEVRLGSAVE